MPDTDAETLILTHQFDLLRVAAGLRADAVAELESLEAHLSLALQNKGDFSVNKAAKLEALLQQTQGQIADAYDKIGKHHTTGLQALAKLEGKQSIKVVNAQIGASVVSVAIAPKLLEAVVADGVIQGHTAKTWWDTQANDLRQKFAGQMRQGVLLGEGIDELTRRVRGTKDKSYTDGIMANKKREAAALVRSSVISTANEARLRSFKEMGDVVKGIAWLSTLDSRTTPECRALDGLSWTLDGYQPVDHDKKFPGPVAHWQCRSTQITVLKSWDELSGKKLPALDDKELEKAIRDELKAAGWSDEKIGQSVMRARASMGQVSAKLDFNDWLKKKDDAFIERVLGPGRAKLWKAGTVQMRDLTDQDNRPLTLKQLADKIEKGIAPPETLGVEWPAVTPAAPFEDPDPVPESQPSKKASPEEIAATAALATQAASKTWAALVKQVIADMPDASSVEHLAVFNEKKLQKQQASMLNDTAAMNVAKGWMPPVTLTMLNKLADDDPAKLAFMDKVKLAKAKIEADSGEAEALKQLEAFKATSDAHAATAGVVAKPGMLASEVLAAATAKLDGVSNAILHQIAAQATSSPPPPAYPLGASTDLSKSIDIIIAKMKPIDPDESPEFDYLDADEIKGIVQNPLMNVTAWGEEHAKINDRSPSATAMQTLLKAVGEVKTVKIADLRIFQTNLVLDKLVSALKEQYDPNIGMPTALRMDGKLYLLDGNHRVYGEHAKGAKEMLISIIDAKYVTKTGGIKEPLPVPKPAVSKATGDPVAVLAAEALAKNLQAGWAELQDVKATASKMAAQKAIEEFKKQSPEHANAADFVLKLYPDPTEAVAELQKQLDSDAKVDLETMAAGGKGVSLIAKAKAAQLLKANPDAGYKELQTVQATVAASIAAGSKTAAVNGALKASIAGKKLNAKQQAALDEMSPEEKADFDSKVEAGKATPAATAAATIATAPDAKVQNLAQDVPDVASMTFVKTLPGSTSPGLYEDTAGKLWVVKKASATSLAHVASESLADAIYRAAGARVPFSTLTKDGKETVKVAEFIPDAKTIGDVGTATAAAQARAHFVLDALLGNWDAVGTGKNNMLVDPAGNLWRIDNGGALAWRAMGTPKDAKWLTPEVQELQTLLNPALNRDAASIYKGITTDEIHRQIREIIDRRAAILSAAEPDPKSRKLLAERIDYLETLLPAAMVPAKAASPTAAIPANIAARIAKARSAGVALRLGANQVEDNNAIVWAERGLDGKDGVRVQLKVTQAGSNDIMAKLKQANVVGGSASASGAVYVQDPDWATIEAMAKHIGFHAGKGTLNPTKLAELPALRAKYQSLAKSKDPVEAATGKYYTELLNDLADAKIDNAKPKKLWKSFNSMVDTDPALAFVKAPKATAPPDGKELQGWAIKRLDIWDTYQTKIGKDGIPERTALANPDLKVIEGYELERGSVRLRFTPQIGLNAGGMRAMHGTIQVWVNGTQMDTGTAQAVAALKELGIDTDEPTLAQQELTYLHKGWYQHNKHTTPEYAAIYGNAALPIEEKLKQIRALSEKTFKVKLPKSAEDWNDDYDPRGFNDASDGTGYRVYYRWDVPRSKMEKEMKGYTLNHFSAHMMDAVKGWLAAGRVTPTYDRIRTGVEVRHGLGMSPLADMETGGAVGFFNSVTNQPTNKGEGAGFRWKVRNLARLDSVNLGNDSFGRFEAYANRHADVATFKKWKTLSRKDQAMLKNGMSFVDELEHIWAESSNQRKAIIDEFKKAGYAVLPDGRKIEDVVTSIK